jgi:hypothetical protein
MRVVKVTGALQSSRLRRQLSVHSDVIVVPAVPSKTQMRLAEGTL